MPLTFLAEYLYIIYKARHIHVCVHCFVLTWRHAWNRFGGDAVVGNHSADNRRCYTIHTWRQPVCWSGNRALSCFLRGKSTSATFIIWLLLKITTFNVYSYTRNYIWYNITDTDFTSLLCLYLGAMAAHVETRSNSNIETSLAHVWFLVLSCTSLHANLGMFLLGVISLCR